MGRGRKSERLDRGNRPKKTERPWTAARTMVVLRRCPLAIAQRLVQCAIAVSTAVLDRVTKTVSVALLLTNNLDNSKQKTSNLLSPAPPPYSWSLLGKIEGPAESGPPSSSKISWSFDLTCRNLDRSTTANTPSYRHQNNRHVDCGPLDERRRRDGHPASMSVTMTSTLCTCRLSRFSFLFHWVRFPITRKLCELSITKSPQPEMTLFFFLFLIYAPEAL